MLERKVWTAGRLLDREAVLGQRDRQHSAGRVLARSESSPAICACCKS